MFKELLDLFSSDSNFQIFREVVNKVFTLMCMYVCICVCLE